MIVKIQDLMLLIVENTNKLLRHNESSKFLTRSDKDKFIPLMLNILIEGERVILLPMTKKREIFICIGNLILDENIDVYLSMQGYLLEIEKALVIDPDEVKDICFYQTIFLSLISYYKKISIYLEEYYLDSLSPLKPEIISVSAKLAKTCLVYISKVTNEEVFNYVLWGFYYLLPIVKADIGFIDDFVVEILKLASSKPSFHEIAVKIICSLSEKTETLDLLISNGLKEHIIQWIDTLKTRVGNLIELQTTYSEILNNVTIFLDEEKLVDIFKDSAIFESLTDLISTCLNSVVNYKALEVLYMLVTEPCLTKYFKFLYFFTVLIDKLPYENNTNNLNLYLQFLKKYFEFQSKLPVSTLEALTSTNSRLLFLKVKEVLESSIFMKVNSDKSLLRSYNQVVDYIESKYPEEESEDIKYLF